MNFKQLVLEALTWEDLESKEAELAEWRTKLDNMVGKEVCSLGAIANGVNFLGPWVLNGRNYVGKRTMGWAVTHKETGKQTAVATPRIFPVEYITLNKLSTSTKDTFGDLVNEL
jgi:hypothetical protein